MLRTRALALTAVATLAVAGCSDPDTSGDQSASGSDGFQIACAQGRESTTSPNRSSFLPKPLSSNA